MKIYYQKSKVLLLLCVSITIIASFASPMYSGFASPENMTLIQLQGIQRMTTTNATNIVPVHGAYADGSSRSKVIPILENAGHKVIAVQMSLHSLADDIATVKRAVALVGEATILVGHSYGGFVITNADYNNSNVTALVYISAFAPDEGQPYSNFINLTKFLKALLVYDSRGFIYQNSTMFRGTFAQDVDPAQADIMAIVQKPINQSIITEKSGPPAWKQLLTWFQISGDDHALPPDMQRLFAKKLMLSL